jgi:hypothetical protein
MLNYQKLLKKLQKVPKEKLIKFIHDTYITENNENLLQKIEVLASGEKIEDKIKLLKEWITKIKRRTRLITYRESHTYSIEIDDLRNSIENDILPHSPQEAFKLTEKLLNSEESIMNAVDDSGGSVGVAMSDVYVLWLKAASKCPPPKNGWKEKIIKINDKNNYGTEDSLLKNANILLSKKELIELYNTYKNKGLTEKKDPNSYTDPKFKAGVEMHKIAEALKDPDLYKNAIAFYSPELNSMQKIRIANFYLLCNQPNKALQLLEGNFEAHNQIEKLSLLNDIYSALNDKEKLIETQKNIYSISPNSETFQDCYKILPEKEKNTLSLKENEKAEKLIIKKHTELKGSQYSSILGIIKIFEKNNAIMPQIICYRALLISILERAFYKAYPHAVKYYQKLIKLNTHDIKYPKGIGAHVEFEQLLKENHGRKSSFWKKVESNSYQQ